jgi:hypothetical protein
LSTANWLTGRADTGGVPALLNRLAVAVPPETIDELWIFPTRRLAGVGSTVLVLALYSDEPDRRRVATVHFKATRNKKGEATVETVLEDHAVAPADRLTRVIDGVLRRLGDDLAATPRTARISGDVDRWEALVEAIASGLQLEEALERVRTNPVRSAGNRFADESGQFGSVGADAPRISSGPGNDLLGPDLTRSDPIDP